MSVDTATRSFLDTLRASGGKPVYEQTIDELRAMVRTVSLQLGPPPVPVHRVVDRRIDVPGGSFGVRIYTPRPLGEGATLPIAVHYHGGGFAAGDLDTHASLAAYYAVHGDAVVVDVDYRRPPEHRFPTAVEDAYAAALWAVDHAREIDGDPGRIAVIGDSAGGNLAAVVCQMAKARGRPAIAFQALIYPCTDMDYSASYASRAQFGGGDYFLSTRDMQFFLSVYAGPTPDVRDPRLSPLAAADLSGLPPALVVTAGHDLLRDEGKAYADRLAAAGVPVEYRCYEQTIHAFISWANAIPTGFEALEFIAARLKAGLHGAPAA